MAELTNLTQVLDHLDDKADGDKLTVDAILKSIGNRGFGPLILAAALIEILPTGAIPGVPTLVAIVIIILSVQLVFGRNCPWLPKKFRSTGFDRTKYEKAREKAKSFTTRVDRIFKPRLHPLTTSFVARIVGVACIALALFMPPLEFVPFASSIPSVAIVLLAIGLTARDGLFVLVGLIAAAAGLVSAVFLLL